jgi:hypothetical protein
LLVAQRLRWPISLLPLSFSQADPSRPNSQSRPKANGWPRLPSPFSLLLLFPPTTNADATPATASVAPIRSQVTLSTPPASSLLPAPGIPSPLLPEAYNMHRNDSSGARISDEVSLPIAGLFGDDISFYTIA